jgi:hypothetical protein
MLIEPPPASAEAIQSWLYFGRRSEDATRFPRLSYWCKQPITLPAIATGDTRDVSPLQTRLGRPRLVEGARGHEGTRRDLEGQLEKKVSARGRRASANEGGSFWELIDLFKSESKSCLSNDTK